MQGHSSVFGSGNRGLPLITSLRSVEVQRRCIGNRRHIDSERIGHGFRCRAVNGGRRNGQVEGTTEILRGTNFQVRQNCRINGNRTVYDQNFIGHRLSCCRGHVENLSAIGDVGNHNRVKGVARTIGTGHNTQFERRVFRTGDRIQGQGRIVGNVRILLFFLFRLRRRFVGIVKSCRTTGFHRRRQRHLRNQFDFLEGIGLRFRFGCVRISGSFADGCFFVTTSHFKIGQANGFDIDFRLGFRFRRRIVFLSLIKVSKTIGRYICATRSSIKVVEIFRFGIALNGFTLKAKVVDVALVQRQVTQSVGEGVDHLLRFDDHRFHRCGRKAGHNCEFVSAVQHRHTTVVDDDDFTDEAIGFFHQHDIEVLTVRQIQADLGAANTDGRDWGVQGHRVGIGFRHLAGHEGEHTLHHRHGHGAFLRARIVNHFIQNHAAVFGHGERGFVCQDHTDGTVFTGFENIALIDRVAQLQFDTGTVRPHGGHRTHQLFDLTNGLFDNAFRTRLGYHSRGGRAGQTRGQIAGHLSALFGCQVRLRIDHEVILHDDLTAVRPGQNKVGALMRVIGRSRVKPFGDHQRFAGGRFYGRGGCISRRHAECAVVLVVGSHGSKPSDAINLRSMGSSRSLDATPENAKCRSRRRNRRIDFCLISGKKN